MGGGGRWEGGSGWGPKSQQMVSAAMKLKDAYSLDPTSTLQVPGKHWAEEHKEIWRFLTQPGKGLSEMQQTAPGSRNVI